MRKLYLLALLFFALPLFAQDNSSGVQYVQSAPVGRCGYQPPLQVVMLTGATYGCVNGNWGLIGGNGVVGVQSINTVTGPFIFTGGGVSCTSTTCTFAGAPPAVTSINGNSGAFSFSGNGVNCNLTNCIFSGGTPPNGVLSINGTAGTFLFNGPGVSCTTNTCTFTSTTGVTALNSLTGNVALAAGANVTITPSGNTLTIASSGGGGGGGVIPATPGQVANYSPAGNTIQGAPKLYAVDPTWSQAQINSLTSGLTGQNTLVIPAGAPQVKYTANSVVPIDGRLGANYLQMPGVACDAKQLPGNITITSGSSQSFVGSFLGTADIGKTFFFFTRSGYGYGSTQSVWTPTMTAYTPVGQLATWSASAPFSGAKQWYYGTDNLATINTAMAQAGLSYPLTIPTGCLMLVNGTIPWNNNQVIVGRHLNQGGFVGRPGADVFATTDTNGQSVSQAGTGLKGFEIVNSTETDWSLGYNLYAADGTLTVVPPVYRPLYDHTSIAPNPLAPGWLTGGKNGVSATTQNSAVICTPNALTPPAVGQTVMFPYFASIFTSTVSSTAGSCSAGFTARTMAAALPNTSAYTSAQAEWFTGSAIQSTTTTIPTSITYPLTLAVTLNTDPTPGWVSDFPQHGTIKVCGIEAEYMGVSSTAMVLRRGPATSAGCTGTTPIAPMNMCRAKNLLGSSSDQPWPVTPSINAGDSTPSGANWFPGECGGNFGIAFPQANGNVFAGSGLSSGFIEDINFTGSAAPGTNSAQANNAGWVYVAGNNAPFASHFQNLAGSNLQYGYVQGPAASGQHGVGAVGPTGFGNTFHNVRFTGAFPLAFVDMQGSDVTDLNLNSGEISPFDGTVIGAATCLQMGFTLDEQTGAGVTSTQYNTIKPYGCEPESGGGSLIEVLPSVDIQGSHITFDTANFEAIPSVFGGDHLKLTNSNLKLPAVDYGSDNDFGVVDGSNAGYITNIWDPAHPQFLEWGSNASCSATAGGHGPAVACGASLVQGYQGRDITPSITGSKAYFPNGGMITPWMWQTNVSFGVNPFTAAGTPDTTAKYWGASSQCALGGSASCHTFNFNTEVSGGFLYMGPFNQLYDGPYVLDATFKSVSSTSSFLLTIRAADSGSGQCSSAGTIFAGTVNTTTSYTAFKQAVDFTGHAGCVLDVTYAGGSTTDTILTDRFNLVPQPLQVLLPIATPTVGAACAGPNSIIGSNTSVPLYCLNNLVVAGSSGGGGTPAGSNTQVQFNNSGAFGADSTFTFDPVSHTFGVFNQNMQAQGIATSTANQNSGQMVMEADVWNGTAGVGVFYGQQVIASTGTNPLTLMNYNCSSTATGPCGANFNYPLLVSNSTPTGDKTTAVATNLSVFNDMPAVIAQYFGAFGDAYKPPNGCSTTASSTTVTCPDGPFVTTDVGKQVWISGAGASGHAFNATITAYTSNTTVTVSAAATGTVTNGVGIFGHDDVTGVQACIQYSSVNAVPCILKAAPSIGQGLTGFLIGSGTLTLTSNNSLEENSGPNVMGNSQSNGTNLFCEFNGDCLALASGPIQGANVSNVAFEEDPTQPNSRGIHLNPQVGTFGNGPFTNSNFNNVNVDNPAKECLFLDGGGGPGYTFNLPNQYVTFNQFWCSGPSQSHPANLMLMTGQAAQILFLNGQVNGQGWVQSGSGGSTSASANYPNPLIKITEKTSAQGDTPVDVKFFGYTFEVGTQGLYIGNGANNIHFDNSYVENISTPFIVTGATANTFNGNHIANSGNITSAYQFASSSGGAIRDNQIYGGIVPAALATCSGNNQVDFANNNSTVTTNNCLYSVAVSGATQGANSCSGATTKTITGLTTQSVITPGYSTDPSGVVGWGSTGGMVFQTWPSAANTLSWKVCNQTSSSITYGGITFNVVFK